MQPPPLFFKFFLMAYFLRPSFLHPILLLRVWFPPAPLTALPRWSAAVRADVASVDWFLYGVVFKPPTTRRRSEKKTSSWAPVEVQGWRGRPVVGAEGPGCNMITVNFASLISATETEVSGPSPTTATPFSVCHQAALRTPVSPPGPF